ncbi:hypothetical protein ACYULU_14675 [Breznakiellaceae bacterium SP9]
MERILKLKRWYSVVPAALAAGTYHFDIVMRYSHGMLLKDIRTITNDVGLTVH